MTVLIIGAGLVGSQIARLEIERGEKVVILDAFPREDALADIFPVDKAKVVQGEILNPFDLSRAVGNEDIDLIYETAAFPGLTLGGQMNPYSAIQLNVMGLVNTLEFARLRNVKKVLFTSSSVLCTYVHPARDGDHLDKEYAYPRPSSIYSSSKLAGENFGLNYAETYGLDFAAVRFAAVFGPWRYGGGGGPTKLIRDILTKSIRGEPVSVASADFEYVYSKDAARGAMLAARSKRSDRIFNIGMGKVFPLKEIASFVKEIIPNASITITERGQEKSDTKAKSAATGGGTGFKLMPDPDFTHPLNLERSTEQLGYKPMFPMRQALEDYVRCLEVMFKH